MVSAILIVYGFAALNSGNFPLGLGFFVLALLCAYLQEISDRLKEQNRILEQQKEIQTVMLNIITHAINKGIR